MDSTQSLVEFIVPTLSRWISHPDYSKHVNVRHIQVPRIVLLKREIDILKTVDHPTLIRLEDVYEDDVNLHLVSQIQEKKLHLTRIWFIRACRTTWKYIGCKAARSFLFVWTCLWNTKENNCRYMPCHSTAVYLADTY